MIQRKKVDIVVVGSGIGGLSYARAVAEGAPHLKVAIVTKKERRESNTNYAQGGIASVVAPSDSFIEHINDTLRAGAGLCDRAVVERVVSAGPAAVRRLAQIGVEFTRSNDDVSGFDLALEGGHSARRVVHADDLTGREIERALLARCAAAENIAMYEDCIAGDVLVADSGDGPHAVGIVAYAAGADEFIIFDSRIVLLATGGAGQVYALTTNPLIATGDGVAMAFRAGCSVANLEFVQFHPTAFYEQAERSLLISEAVRGHGAILRTRSGRAFMQDYDDRADLAPRDIVARAIDNELKKSGDEFVQLDLSAMDTTTIKKRFPNIYQGCKERGVDITSEPIPVAPSAHYLCGGVRATLDGLTDLPGLLACGETTQTGMHGANRLASNSLLEAVVMAEFAAEWTLANESRFTAVTACELPAYVHEHQRSHERILLAHERAELKRLMSDYLGIVRSLARLKLARERLEIISATVSREMSEIPDVYGVLELRNLVEVALMMTDMALERHESRGLHYLVDYPETDDIHWKHDSVIKPAVDGARIVEHV